MFRTLRLTRNPDIAEAVLDDGEKPVKFCIATGFRNIQTLVRKLKARTTMPHYVEIMACPTGEISINNTIYNKYQFQASDSKVTV